MSGHLEVIRVERDPLESGWWEDHDEPMLRPVYQWVEDDQGDGDDE